MATVLSDDYAMVTPPGPYSAENSVWNVGNLVNGKDFTQSLTLEDSNTPNINTAINWSYPNTPASGNVYGYPAVHYGNYFNDAATVAPEQIGNIKTLTLSNNVTLSGNGDNYDAIYDLFTTSTPGGDPSKPIHEIEVQIHTPSYDQQFVNGLPSQNKHQFTDANGMQWTIAESTNSNIVSFLPSNYQDLTNATIDFKALLQAAVADGVLSGNEYFNGLALGNEAREGTGGMTINSLSVNYDGDPNFHASGTGGTPVADPPPATNPPAGANPPAAGDPPATNTPPATNSPPVASSPPATGTGQDPATNTHHHHHNGATHAGDPPPATNTPPATNSTTGTNTPPATGSGQDPASNTHHHHHHAAGGAGAGDPAAGGGADPAAGGGADAPAGGGADPAAGGDAPAAPVAITTVRNDALLPSHDLAQAGAVFNDATRLLDGGLWDTPADSNNQIAYLGMYTTDIHAVLNDINGMLANPGGVTIGGAALNLADADTAVLTQVQGQLQTLLTLANGSVGNSATAATNQELLHTTHTSILNEINGDTALANALGGATYAGGTGADNAGFQALPTGADDAAALAKATAGATLQDVGTVFNAASALAVGGLNQTNLGQFDTDMKAVLAGLTNIANNPDALAQINQAANLTGVDAATTKLHLDTVIEQVNAQINNFDAEYATNPNVAARATNDNLLDMIDIMQGDTALNAAAGGNGNPGNVGGFSEMPAFLEGTITRFQDDQAQTNFWAQFVAEGNVINDQLNNVAAGNNTTPGELQALITEIQNYQQSSAAFDHSQGGVFGARFDNELLGGTLNADTSNAVHGLQGILNGDAGDALAADQAQIQAAGAGFVGDAGDVSGNNIPLGGGDYVGDSRTVEGATSVPGAAQGTIPVGPVAPGDPAGGGGQGGTGGQGTGGGTGGQGTGGTGGQGGAGQGNGGQGTGGHGHHGGPVASGGNDGHGHHNAGGQSAGDDDDGQVAQGGGQGGNAGHGNHGAAGQSAGDGDDGQVAQAGNHGGQGNACHGCGGNSGEHGSHGGQPIPTFWNFVQNEHNQGVDNHHQFELMWHHG